MPSVVPDLAGSNSSPTTPAQPSAPWLTDIPVSLSTQIPSVRKPIRNTLLVIPPRQAILITSAATPAWCKPVSRQFWWPWQHPSVSSLHTVSFFHGSCRRLPTLGGQFAFAAVASTWSRAQVLGLPLKSPMVFPSVCSSVFSLCLALHCCLGGWPRAPPQGCRWQLLEVNHFKTHLR